MIIKHTVSWNSGNGARQPRVFAITMNTARWAMAEGFYLDGVPREFHSFRRVREQPEQEGGWALKQIPRHATRQERNVDVAPRQRVQQRPNQRQKDSAVPKTQ